MVNIPGQQVSKEEMEEAFNATFPPDEVMPSTKAMPADGNVWEEVGGGGGSEPVWDFGQPPESKPIEGILLDVRKSIGRYNQNLYVIQVPDLNGKPYGVWGCTVLDNKFYSDTDTIPKGKDLQIPLGSKVRIVYMGTDPNSKGGRNPAKLYKVFFIRPEKLPQ